MATRLMLRLRLLLSAAVIASSCVATAQEKPPEKATLAKILVTVLGTRGENPPEVKREDVIVRVGKQRVKVKHWEAARGQYADLALFIVIDDVLDPATSGLTSDLKQFIQAQPSTTMIGTAYMRSGSVQIAQDLTTDHDKAVQSLRLPVGDVGTYGSPYLSLVDLLKRWPEHGGRREILMVTDGIDRMHRPTSRTEAMTASIYVDSASRAAQRAGIPVYSIYARGVGHASLNMWLANGGQSGISQLAEETGAETYFLGYTNPVSFMPYLEDLQKKLNNQYWLAIDLPAGAKPALKPIKITTELRGVEIIAADNIFVPAAK